MMKIVVGLAVVLGLVASIQAQLAPCTACEFFSGYIIEQLGTDLLNSFCLQTPTFLRSSCTAWVRANKGQIANVLNSGGSAAQICRQLGACTSFHSKPTSAVQMYEQLLQGDAGCDVCIMTIWEVQRQLKNNITVDNIQSVLNQVCASVPIYQQECFGWVRNDLPQLVKYLMDRDSAQQICQSIAACQNASTVIDSKSRLSRQRLFAYIATHPLHLSSDATSSSCQLCQWVISAFESWLSDGHTQEEITNFLQQVCPFFNEYAAQCEQLVEVYTPKFIENLIQSETPPIACTQFGVCPAN